MTRCVKMAYSIPEISNATLFPKPTPSISMTKNLQLEAEAPDRKYSVMFPTLFTQVRCRAEYSLSTNSHSGFGSNSCAYGRRAYRGPNSVRAAHGLLILHVFPSQPQHLYLENKDGQESGTTVQGCYTCN